MNKIYKALAALMVLLVMTMGASALKPEKISTEGESAAADIVEVTADGIMTDTYITAWKTNNELMVYVSIFSSDQSGNYKYEYGYANQAAFSTNGKKLDTAELTVGSIQLGTDVCGEYFCEYVPTRTLNNLKVSWTGTGAVQKGSYLYKSKGYDYFFMANGRSYSRNAIATAVADEKDFGSTEFANLGIFKEALIYRAK